MDEMWFALKYYARDQAGLISCIILSQLGPGHKISKFNIVAATYFELWLFYGKDLAKSKPK